MLLPKLFGNFWVFLVVFVALISFDWSDIAKGHRTLKAILSSAPWTYWPVVFVVFVIAYQLDKKGAERLLEVGVVAPAVVVEVRDTGVELGVNPVFTLRVRVTPSNEAPFESDLPHVPSRPNMGAVQPGMQLTVRYDPHDHRRIAVASGP